MGRNPLIQVQYIIFLVFVALFTFGSSVYTPWTKYHVRIVTKLPNHIPLGIHCTNQKDDRGFHSITEIGQSYEFSFRMNFKQSTQFTCDLSFMTDHQYLTSFVAFKAADDFIFKCVKGTICTWTATQEGIYFTNYEKKREELWYEWSISGSKA
ncbi:S-protein homolog 6-like [Rutidosis leptorrhynchoides]|uniref:S-protein homolog 6-like n=1 Tax=Rutidosis leptorrhynchoides TaxID=125765 RepID=UPI003A99221A